MLQAIAYYEAALKQGGQQFLRSELVSFITLIHAGMRTVLDL